MRSQRDKTYTSYKFQRKEQNMIIETFDLIYYPESSNPQYDVFKYKEDWEGLQTYAKDKDGWFIDLAYWHPITGLYPKRA